MEGSEANTGELLRDKMRGLRTKVAMLRDPYCHGLLALLGWGPICVPVCLGGY